MPLRRFFREEQVGFIIGWTAAFVVDNVVKVGAMKYAYRTVSWIASKTKISPLTAEVLFERVVDGVWTAY